MSTQIQKLKYQAIKKLIEEGVLGNYGSSELRDPSGNIENLADYLYMNIGNVKIKYKKRK